MSCHYYRQTSFYFASLHCTLQLLHFLQIEVLWQPCIEQVYRCHFSNGVCSFCVSVSHLGNSCNISLFHYYHFLWSVISHTIHATMTHWKFRWWLAFFSNNIFKLMYICFFRCNAVCVCVCVCVCVYVGRPVMSDFCNPRDCSPPGSPVHGILQARTLESVAVSFLQM